MASAPALDFASFGFNAGGWTSNSQYPRTLADITGDGFADIIGFGDAGVFVALSHEFVV